MLDNTLWYPYTQMKTATKYPTVEKGQGEFLYLDDEKEVVDGLSSWWSTIHGYNHPKLNSALSKQLLNFSHVMLGGLTHQPAENFAKKIVEITPAGLNHVFFSDSGSVAVEVALKMSIQYWANQGEVNKVKFLSLRNSYHGDTFKAMEIGDDSDFQESFQHALNKGFYLNTPTGGFNATETELKDDFDALERMLSNHGHEIAAFILEPIVQCAGGFKIYSPLYLNAASRLCEKYKVLLVFDEVATGFGRTGKFFAAEHSDIVPDIMVLGKALTAGYLGHAATVTKSKVFNAFLGTSYEQAFMHGPTFMGNPLSCAVGLESIEVFNDENYLNKINHITSTLKNELNHFKHPEVLCTKVIGAIGVIEVKDQESLSNFREYALQHGVWLRPFGKYLYTAPPYIIGEKQLLKITTTMKNWFTIKT